MEIHYGPLDGIMEDFKIRFLVQEPMAPYTTFKIGGPADRMIFPETEEQFSIVKDILDEYEYPWILLGNGSNILVPDEGIRGVAVCLSGDFKKVELLPDGRTLRAGAGASLASLCACARENGLTGLEFAWGIPGTVGGAIYMNAGAYGGEMKDVIARVDHNDKFGSPCTTPACELSFSYRRSCFMDRYDVITGAEFTLAPGDPCQIAAKMDELMARRKEKQPYDMPSAGSVFKRPANGYASAMIEQCGLKGRRVGGAQVSEKHAGFIVNTGGATCKDVRELIGIVQETVKAQTGTELACEVNVLEEKLWDYFE